MHINIGIWRNLYRLLHPSGSPDFVLSWVARGPGIPLLCPDQTDADLIINTINAGGSASAVFPADPPKVGFLDLFAGRANAFTSIGGSFDLDIKPDIGAPGGRIYSTWPGGGYEVLSGTSMACPYVAGVAALWIGKNGGRSVHGAEALRKT